jgi:flagellar assembly protein FliH
MSSSEGATAAPPRITTFAFEQLDSVKLPHSAGDPVASAWDEAEQVRTQARQSGEAEGRAEGLAAIRAEAEPALQALAAATQALEQARVTMAEALEAQAAELGLRIAEQIVAAELELEPERIVDIARGALRRLAERDRVTIIVNPIDLELLSGSIEQLRSELGGISHITVHAERRIDRGGAVVRTELGEIDATVTTQLERAREIVAAAIRTEDEAASDDLDEPIVVGESDGLIVVEESDEPVVSDASPEPVATAEPTDADPADPQPTDADPADDEPTDDEPADDELADDDVDFVIGEVVDD